MSTINNEKELYQAFYKEGFLNDKKNRFTDGTKSTYRRIFAESAELESELEKDLYEFNVKELVKLLTELKPDSPNSSRTNGRIIASYVNWTIRNNIKKNKVNPIGSVPVAWFDQFVQKNGDFITEKQLNTIINYCNNYQDAVIFKLLWEGVQGKSCCELTNLTKHDIKGNVLALRDENMHITRHVAVDWDTIDLINGAIKQKRYLKKNGEMEHNDFGDEEIDLVRNDFILRNSMTSAETFNCGVDKHTVYRRIAVIREQTGFMHLTVKDIVKSGMIKMAYDLREKYGELNKSVVDKIAERFQFNHTWYIKDFVNDVIIDELYGKTNIIDNKTLHVVG
jgi:hypothetical protein